MNIIELMNTVQVDQYVYWNDPEGQTSGIYKLLQNNEEEFNRLSDEEKEDCDDWILLIGNEHSEAEVTANELEIPNQLYVENPKKKGIWLLTDEINTSEELINRCQVELPGVQTLVFKHFDDSTETKLSTILSGKKENIKVKATALFGSEIVNFYDENFFIPDDEWYEENCGVDDSKEFTTIEQYQSYCEGINDSADWDKASVIHPQFILTLQTLCPHCEHWRNYFADKEVVHCVDCGQKLK